jgi:hypothetical protein
VARSRWSTAHIFARIRASIGAAIPVAGSARDAHGVTEQRYRLGRAYRDGRLVCWRVHVTIGRDDTRLGLAPRERRYVTASFRERLDSALHAELVQLAHRRGAAARRIAESIEPIVLVVDDPHNGDRHRMIVRLQPPQVRGGVLSEVEFGVRELPAP